MEAMACGVPVIGTRVRGIRDVVIDGRNGVLCEPNPASIRSSIEAVLCDAPLRKRLIEGGLEYIRTSSTLEHVLATEVAILQSAEGGRAA
jgi:glycosyltransferase involved in cell wall biosynthesis